MGRMVESFSFSPDEIEVINECKKIAKEDGVSFGQVVMRQLKELVHQKKAFEAAAKGENISLSILGYDHILAEQQEQQQEQSPRQEHKSNLVKTLDQWIDNNIVGQRNWEPALAEIDSIGRLDKYASLGRNITTAANKQVSYLKLVRSNRNGVSGG